MLRLDLDYETQGCEILREGTMTRVEVVTKWFGTNKTGSATRVAVRGGRVVKGQLSRGSLQCTGQDHVLEAEKA